MKAIARDQDKKAALELLSDNQTHTKHEIEAETGNWFVDAIIKELRKDGYSIKRTNYGRGVIVYRMTSKPRIDEKKLFA
jgi:hypothetical protein